MTLSRRRFLQGMGVAGAAAGLSACGASTTKLVEPPAPRPASPILVVVDLQGGNDWLNMMPPLAGQNRVEYEKLRPNLLVPGDQMVAVGAGAGLSPHFTGLGLVQGMDYLSNVGRVAWIPGIGMNNPNLSHFVSTDLWGQGAAAPNGTGWLGRFADQAFDPAGDVLRGITVTSDLPVMLRGSARSFVSIGSSSGYVYPAALRSGRLRAPWDAVQIEAGFAAAVGTTPAGASPSYAAAARAGKLFLDAQNGFGVDGTLPARTPSVPYPGDAAYPVKRLDGGALGSTLARQFKLIAQMLANGVQAEVFFTRVGGWDTHANQLVDHPNLQRALGCSIAAFYEDLGSIQTAQGNARERTMLLAWSEFGRRVKENDGGTDHGTAGLAFCVGRGVRGGFYGAYPDLANLDANGNMRFTTDFRSLYATVLEGWLGRSGPQTDAILGASYPRLGFV
jgi:uncharacterized protein (DUF1501 family)